jgi:FKBP-type peptidyl-prolyl cis-trans isomerase SlyD
MTPPPALDLVTGRPRDNRSVEHGTVVGYRHTTRDEHGHVIDVSAPGHLTYYLHGAGTTPVGLEAALAGTRAGDVRVMTLAPCDAFGERAPAREVTLRRTIFRDSMAFEPGTRIDAATSEGLTVAMWIVDVDADHVRLAFEHPLAGRTLHFEVSVVSVRSALPSELRRRRPRSFAAHSPWRTTSAPIVRTAPRALAARWPKTTLPRFLLQQVRTIRSAHPANLKVELFRLRALMALAFAGEAARDANEPRLIVCEARLAERRRLLSELDGVLHQDDPPSRAISRAVRRMIRHLSSSETSSIARLQENFQRDIGGSG